MRLRKLSLQSYGHFQDVTLEFPGDRLQVVHGQNEAGKSTLLGFIRDILFGFGAPSSNSSYAIRPTRNEGTCRMELADRTTFEFRRRRSQPDQLTRMFDGTTTTLTQADLQQVLGGANSSLYRNIFAFGLKELAEGEGTLKDESIQHSLHGSGVGGLAHPQKILDLFTKDCEAIFKPGARASKPEIAVLLSELKELGSELKARLTRTETFHQRQREFDEATATADQLALQLTAVRKELARIRRLVKAYTPWKEAQDLSIQAAELQDTPRLEPEAAILYRNGLDEIGRITTELGKIDRDLKGADFELQQHPEQTVWLARRNEIERAREQIQSVQEARRDLPLRQTELQSLTDSVRQGIADVISDWTTDHLTAFHCDARLLHQGEELAKSRVALEQQRIRLDQRELELRQQQTDIESELDSLGEIEDVTTLQTLVDNHAEYLSIDKDLNRLQKEQSRLERQIASQAKKLAPPLPSSATDIGALPVPPEMELNHYQQELESLTQQINTATKTWHDAVAQHEQAVRELELVRGALQTIPTRSELQRLRSDRDTGWSLIRSKYIERTDVEQSERDWLAGGARSLPDQFSLSLQKTDAYADSLFDNASLVHKQEQVESLQQVAETRKRELDAFELQRQEFNVRWNALWQPCQLQPLSPDSMLAWKAQHVALREMLQNALILGDEIKQLEFRRDLLLGKLATALPHEPDDPEIRWSVARQRVERYGRLTQERKTHQKALTRIGKNSLQCQKDRQELESQTEEWTSACVEWLKRLDFPTDWRPEFALQVVARLQGLREKLAQIPSLQVRIDAMRTRIQEFDPFVMELCESLAPEWCSQPTDVAARQLSDRLARAVATDQRRRELNLSIAQFERQRADLEEQLATTRARRLEFLHRAKVENDQDFFEVALRNDKLRNWEREIEARKQELTRLRELEDEADFHAQLQQCQFSELSQQLQSQEQQIAELESQERAANERKGVAKRALDELDGSSVAAEIQGRIAQRRAALANAVERYVPILFAQQILQQTLLRFEKESQPAMLKDVSQLFSTMTGGRYLRVERPRETGRPLVVHRSDTEELEPDQLSTGTREQLFLAIRLAYVLHYCSRTEPLPIVLDDVLANFDPPRTRRTLESLGQLTDRIQVLLFTCHPHVVTLAQEVFSGLQPIEVPASSSV